MYLTEKNDPWLGPAHLRVAAMFARDPNLHSEARHHLEMAQAWLRRREALPKHEVFNWQLTAEDLAHSIEAVYWIDGYEAAARWLGRWRPLSSLVVALAEYLPKRVNPADLEAQIAALSLPARLRGSTPGWSSCGWAYALTSASERSRQGLGCPRLQAREASWVVGTPVL